MGINTLRTSIPIYICNLCSKRLKELMTNKNEMAGIGKKEIKYLFSGGPPFPL